MKYFPILFCLASNVSSILNDGYNTDGVCFKSESSDLQRYRSGTVNSNTVNSKFHLIRIFFEILARILSFHV